jgi:hypothetical protein
MRQPLNPDRPAVDVTQLNDLFFGSGGEAPLSLNIEISNPAKEPIIVRRVRVSASGGMSQYTIRPAERFVRQEVAPGGSTTVEITATAYTNIVRLHPTEPLSLRTVVDYESGGKRHQELYLLLTVGQ